MGDQTHSVDERPDSAHPDATWDLSETAPAAFRKQVWWILGRSRKQDVLLAVRDLAGTGRPLAQVDIASKAVEYPHFADTDSKPDLSDNDDLEPLKAVLALVAVPRLQRPPFEYVCPFEAMCEYLVNPFHAPTDGRVAAAIEYVTTNQAVQEESDRGGTDDLPIDPFSAEGYTYVRLSDILVGTDPKVRFERFRPNDFGARKATGFEVRGTLTADDLDLAPGVTDSELKNALEAVFVELVDHAAREKNHFRIGLYSPDNGETEGDVRRRAIREYASFQTFDPDVESGVITFDWMVEPVMV